MVDHLTKEQRSWNMSRIRSTNTKPEKLVRSMLHRKGYRFRIHQNKLPGKPDIVLPKYKTAILINGCFWHRHEGCKRAFTPKTNPDKWAKKFKKNVDRDRINQKNLIELGWKVIVIWECEIKNDTYTEKLNLKN